MRDVSTDHFYHRVFFQPSISAGLPQVRLILSSRFSFVHSPNQQKLTDDVYWEPCANLKIGGKYFRVVLQSAFIVHFEEGLGYNQNPVLLSLGFEWNLPSKKAFPRIIPRDGH